MKRLALLLSAMLIAGAAHAAQPKRVQFNAKDTRGQDVVVPAKDGPAVIAFLRPGQPQSDEALQQIRDAVAKQPSAKLICIFSGPDNVAAAPAYVKDKSITTPVVMDPDYAFSGQMNIHVWPATIVVSQEGAETGRLSGLPSSFAVDLQAHLDFALKKIDEAAHEKRLATRQVVAATSQQAATRYLIIASALQERGQYDKALAEIEQGLKKDATDVSLRLARARLLLKLESFDAALAAADELVDSAPAWQIQLIRAEALIALARWPDAKSAVADAIKLNPNPAHAHYLSGLIHAHDQNWPAAAEDFRRAYEAQASKK